MDQKEQLEVIVEMQKKTIADRHEAFDAIFKRASREKYFFTFDDYSTFMSIPYTPEVGSMFLALITIPLARQAIETELAAFLIEVPESRIVNVLERLYTKLAELFYPISVELGKKVGVVAERKAITALSMYLASGVFDEVVTEKFFKGKWADVERLAKEFKWSELKANLQLTITAVMNEMFNVQGYLQTIKAHPLAAPIAKGLADDIKKKILRGDLEDMPLDKEIKLFNDNINILAKLTGEFETSTNINIGFAQVYQKLDQIKLENLPDVKAEYKLLE